ncbi:hypothetical protein FI667_g7657, partial [Globisporangium splendens]
MATRVQRSSLRTRRRRGSFLSSSPLTETVDSTSDDGDAHHAQINGVNGTPANATSEALRASAKKLKTTSKRDRSTSGRHRKKPTYYMRKDEMKELLQQIDTLQARVQNLQEANLAGINLKDLNNPSKFENERLRHAVDGQEYSIANVQSALGGYLNKRDRLPYESTICLSKDRAQRHATLLAMKDKKLGDSLRYLNERTKFLDPMTPHAEASRYVTPTGNYCILQLDVTPFEGAQSVKQVFDALKFFFFNMEISISEILGETTIREDDGTWHHGVFESRIVSNVTSGVQVEMNSAMFSAFYDQHDEYGGGRPFGVIAGDFVDIDELHPYSPATRVRFDATGVLSITSEIRTKVTADGEEEEELVVVLTRSGLLQLHDTEFPLLPHVVHEMRDSIARWGDAMLMKMREIVYPQAFGSSRLSSGELL